MRISHRSVARLDALLAVTADLKERVGTRCATGNAAVVQQWEPVLENIGRYVALIEQGRSSDDPVPALKGANLLTTVNKGVGDAEQEPADRNLAELAFEVTRRAIDAARSLRDDAGVVLV